MGHTFIRQFCEKFLKLHRIRRCQRAIFIPCRGENAGCTDACCRKTCIGPNLLGKGSHRGFAAGAGNGSHYLRLFAIECCSSHCQRMARVFAAQHRHSDALGIHVFIGQNCNCTAFDSISRIGRTVIFHAFQSRKQATLLYLTGIGTQSGNLSLRD